ncbi:MAG: ANTAR domain-containing protein [Firmicutes bacterium]|nr:ANTAR domain-containing protein [Bacillota bacterium]
MDLMERTYSALVVSAAEKLNTALSELLAGACCRPVSTVSNISAAKRACSERSFDFVIINSPLPDDPGIRFAIDMAAGKGTVVLLLVRGEFYDEVYDKVVVHGVFMLSRPLSRQLMETGLDWMASARERLRKLEKKTLSVEDKMEEIRVVNRAKWILISELKMDEPQAHRYIEKQAMDRCIPRKEIAAEIIRTYT